LHYQAEISKVTADTASWLKVQSLDTGEGERPGKGLYLNLKVG
jgi:hypothetical protein